MDTNHEYEYVIDFDKLGKGSDLWLFWQASNKNLDDLVVLLTPSFDSRVWYEKLNPANKDGASQKLVIYAGSLGEVSYRFFLPRKDAKDWPNLVEEQKK